MTRLAGVLDFPVAYFHAEDDDLAEVIVEHANKSRNTRKRRPA